MSQITRDVVNDLWPLYVSGDASADSRRLVEAYLSEDPEFARALSVASRDRLARLEAPSLAPDHELRTLSRIRRRLAGPVWLLQLALIFTCFAFGRIVSDTSFDVSPRNFIVTAAVAGCFWVAFFVKLLKGRRDVLLRIRR
jgi:anti-sigma factor RsiW